MFERFTDRARRVVVLAQEEARMLNHNYIGTEHILLGLVHEGEGVAALVLTGLGVSLEDVRRQVQEIIGEGGRAPAGHIPFTPRAKKVLELSLRESLQLGHSYIGTEHILLGLIREGEGVAAQVMQHMGIGLERARAEIIRLLGGEGVTAAPETVAASGSVEAEYGVEAEHIGPQVARCPSCRASLSGTGIITPLDIEDEDGRRTSVRILYCGSCGVAIGTVA
jgi:ATP-dependent Clp protease ATP-binding subunit ClpC